jgi:hypothetical protein
MFQKANEVEGKQEGRTFSEENTIKTILLRYSGKNYYSKICRVKSHTKYSFSQNTWEEQFFEDFPGKTIFRIH